MENKSEKRGFLWLTVVLALVLAVLLIVRLTRRTADKEETEWAKMGVAEGDTSEVGYRLRSGQGEGKDRLRVKQGQSKGKAYYGKWEKRDRKWNREERKELEEPAFERKERKEFVVDLNSADTLDLMEIYGVGPYFARAIVKYREKLGGYVSKEQLMEVYGMKEDRYGEIAKHVRLDGEGVKRINVNQADVKELKSHPYLDYWHAKAIVELREKGTSYRSAEDLLQVSLLDEETIKKIEPYLEY